MANHNGERGVAIVMALLAVLVLSAVSAGLMLTATTEAMIAGHFQTGRELRYATESILARAVHELGTTADWPAVAAGEVHSTFVDGAPGIRTLPDGSTLDLTQLDLPSPDWHLFAYGSLRALLQDGTSSRCYLLVAGAGISADRKRLVLQARGFGARGARQVVQAVVAQVDRAPGVRVLSWRSEP